MPLPEGATLTLEPVWLLVDAFHLTREVSYGASALLLWDMCLTFADEVGTPQLQFASRGTDKSLFPIGRFNMVCKVERYNRPVSCQSLYRASHDLPWGVECASGHRNVWMNNLTNFLS